MPAGPHAFLEEVARAPGARHGLARRRRLRAGARGAASSTGSGSRLIPLVTIKESYFFRAPQQFEVIRQQVLPRLLRARAAVAAPAHLVGGLRPRRGAGDARHAARRGAVPRRLGLDASWRPTSTRRRSAGARLRALRRAGGGAGAAGPAGALLRARAASSSSSTPSCARGIDYRHAQPRPPALRAAVAEASTSSCCATS